MNKTEKTLLLNATYEPLKIISWQKAVYLYFLGKVEIVESYERTIGSISCSLQVPAVVRVKKFIKYQRSFRHVKFTRNNVFARDRFTCQYCGTHFQAKELTFDHVIPASIGGETTFENIVTACKPCNMKKGDKPLNKAGMKLISSAYRPHWPISVSIMLGMQKQYPNEWNVYLFNK